MKTYTVIIEEPAQDNIKTSYQWGCRVWGKAKAGQWVRQLRAAIKQQLATFLEPGTGVLQCFFLSGALGNAVGYPV